jgi:hypothetical protein
MRAAGVSRCSAGAAFLRKPYTFASAATCVGRRYSTTAAVCLPPLAALVGGLVRNDLEISAVEQVI